MRSMENDSLKTNFQSFFEPMLHVHFTHKIHHPQIVKRERQCFKCLQSSICEGGKGSRGWPLSIIGGQKGFGKT